MSQRISRDVMLIRMAKVVSQRSTCRRLEVGAIVSREGRPLATGYNGSPAGMPHCDHLDCTCDYPTHLLGGDPSCHKHGACRTAVHAEVNAIAFAAKNGVMIDGADLHVTHQPCLSCAMLVINAGITHVVYMTEYREKTGVELLNSAGVEVEMLRGSA